MNVPPQIVPTTMLEMARQIIDGKHPEAPFLAQLGIRLTTIEPGRARMEVKVGAGHANPMGTLHGGVPCTLADAAMGFAYASTLAKGESFTTLELKINFLRPVWTGLLVGEGVVVQRGRTIGLAECSVTDEKGRLIAKASSTCMTLRDQQTQGR